MESKSPAPNLRVDTAAKATALANLFSALAGDSITADDVEWMYSYVSATPLLDAMQLRLQPATDCLIPLGSTHVNRLPLEPNLFDPILAGLPEAGDSSSSITILNSSLSASRKRLHLLQQQRSKLQEMLRTAVSESETRHGAFVESLASKEHEVREQLSILENTTGKVKIALSHCRERAKAQATELCVALSSYFQSERDQWTSLEHAWNGASDSSRLPSDSSATATFGIHKREIDFLSDGFASAEENRIFAIANLARATACYQSLRNYRKRKALETTQLDILTFDRDELAKTHSSWAIRMKTEISPLLLSLDSKYVNDKVRLQYLQDLSSNQEKCISLYQMTNFVLATQRVRLAILAETLRNRGDHITSTCNHLSSLCKALGDCRKEREMFMKHSGNPSNTMPYEGDGKDKNQERVNLSNNRCTPFFYLEGRRLQTKFDNVVISVLREALRTFREQIGVDERWLVIDNTRSMVNGLRTLQLAVADAGHNLEELMTYVSKRLTPSMRHRAGRDAWITFFALVMDGESTNHRDGWTVSASTLT